MLTTTPEIVLMFTSIVKRGNAIVPYQEVTRQDFHTEFAARLFGYLSCLDDQYRHWNVKGIKA